jgi:P27 family predicted phage terminase small subunit
MRGGHLVKSVEDHKKTGTYKPSRHANRIQEHSKPFETLPEPPANFDQRHKDKWIEVCKNIESLKILANQDLDLLEVYVRNWFMWQDSALEVAASGITYIDENGKITKNPAFNIMQESGKVITQIGALIGYSPRARMGIKVQGNEKAKQASILDLIKGGAVAKIKTG